MLLRFLRRRSASSTGSSSLLARIEARTPPDGAPGLLPAADPAEGEEELRLGDRFATELHRLARSDLPWLGQSRRLAAIASSARRTSAAELEEAIQGVQPWELTALLESLATRKDVPARRLAKAARDLATRATDFPTLAAALGLLRSGVELEDRPLLFLAGRSPALAGVCSHTLEGLPPEEVDGALLALATGSAGLGRALALERLAARHLPDPPPFDPLIPRALELAAAIEDPLERAYAAVPLLEVARLSDHLASRPELATPAAVCLEAVSRGGWNGGPGPGIGRLPGATRASLELLTLQGLPGEARLIAARAVVDARPIPSGPARQAAEKILAGE